jgi:hypothetical protein
VPNLAIPTPDGAFWGLKFHQVAIYHADPDDAIQFWVDAGYDNWHEDQATLVGTEHGESSQKDAQMFFNYDVMPLELEYVHYSTEYRNSRDMRDGHPPFISHLSTYVEDLDDEVQRIREEFAQDPYHRFLTYNHENPNVVGVKRFREAIFDTSNLLGYDIKLIQRVPWDYEEEGLPE